VETQIPHGMTKELIPQTGVDKIIPRNIYEKLLTDRLPDGSEWEGFN
jgi:hypothetical protein